MATADIQSERPSDALRGVEVGGRLAGWSTIGLYYALAVVFIWFGLMKFTDVEAASIAGLVMNSPLVGWWHALLGIKGTSLMLGVYEIATGLLLASRVLSTRTSAVGAAMSVLTYLVTVSFLFSTPGVGEPRAGGFPAISVLPGQFLLKDIVLLTVSIYLLGESLSAKARRTFGRSAR